MNIDKKKAKTLERPPHIQRDIVWALQEERDNALVLYVRGVDPLENKLKSQRLTEEIRRIQRARAKEQTELIDKRMSARLS